MRRTLLVLFAAFFLSGIMIIAEVNAGSYILLPTDDTWIYGYASYPDTNFGGEQGFATNMHSYNQLGFPFLKFSIPTFSGEEIQTATLHLYQYDGAGVGVQATVIDLYSVNMWDENTITWNNFYNPSATVTYLATCNDGALYRGWSSWSFAWHKSYGDTITIRIREGGSADNSHVWSSKEYSNADLRPYLELITMESFPWEIFYPAIIKKSINPEPSGFTQDELLGKTFHITDNDYPTCIYDTTFINDHQLVDPDGGTYNYIIDNGSIVISDPPVSTTVSVLSRNGSVITVKVSLTGAETFVDQTDLWGIDFSSLNNSATALKDWFIANGFGPNSTITADGRVTNQAASFDGRWWINDNVFYFAYPENDGCVDYKAYKLVNNRLLFATDANYTTTQTVEIVLN